MTDTTTVHVSVDRLRRSVSLIAQRFFARVTASPLDTQLTVGPLTEDQLAAFLALEDALAPKVVGTISQITTP